MPVVLGSFRQETGVVVNELEIRWPCLGLQARCVLSHEFAMLLQNHRSQLTQSAHPLFCCNAFLLGWQIT